MSTIGQPRVDPRSPCIIGTGRATWRGAASSPEPVDMWADVARAAAADATVGAKPRTERMVVDAIDDLGVVHCQSWYYDDPTRRFAERLGLRDGRREQSILAGTSPQRLLSSAAERMLAGETNVALVVGAEAQAARKLYDRAGTTPPWSHPHATPPLLPVELEEWYLPTEIAHFILPAWLTFALLEQARWAERGGTRADREHLEVILDHLNSVAADNPDAWFRERRTGIEIVSPSADNRVIAAPYTKRMTAFPDVDMAAANLMVTHEIAEEWGVPPERRVYLRGWGFARDEVHLAQRRELGSSPGMRAATSAAFAQADLTVEDVDLFDFYSCFTSAVQFATDALGLDEHDKRPLSVTGGLAYHGGPGSNYMGHSISHMVDRLRCGDGEVGMVTGVGMHMTKHVAGIWSTRPGAIGAADPTGPQSWNGPSEDEATLPTVLDSFEGRAAVKAATTVHHPSTQAPYVVAICEIEPTVRAYARSDDPALVAAVDAGEWVGATAFLRPNGSCNELRLVD